MFLAGVGVCALTVGGVAIQLTRETQKINRLALHAERTTAELTRQSAIRRKLRNKQVAELQAATIIDCQGRHKIIQVLEEIVGSSPQPPELTPAQKKFYAAQTAKTLTALASADCLGIDALSR